METTGSQQPSCKAPTAEKLANISPSRLLDLHNHVRSDPGLRTGRGNRPATSIGARGGLSWSMISFCRAGEGGERLQGQATYILAPLKSVNMHTTSIVHDCKSKYIPIVSIVVAFLGLPDRILIIFLVKPIKGTIQWRLYRICIDVCTFTFNNEGSIYVYIHTYIYTYSLHCRSFLGVTL